MMTPMQTITMIRRKIKPEWKTAFFSAFLTGLVTHMPILLSDIPNHDGLSSMYFDQNMITSGRWFLTVACGFSSYYTLPWLIGLIGFWWLSCAAVVLTEFLELQDRVVIALVSGLLVTFPALTSTFAYVYTLDGYMMALFLSVLSVLLVQKGRYGFLAGAVCLAFSMGIYQAYLPFAVILCLYAIVMLALESGTVGGKIKKGVKYLYMGAIGAALYYVILQILLRVQGKALADYQGISGMEGNGASVGIKDMLSHMYRDFFSFTCKGNVLFHNLFSLTALLVLAVLTAATLFVLFVQKKWWKNPYFFIIIGLLALGCPVASNLILAISPNVTYHLLMRYQWILYPILMLAFVSRYGGWERKKGAGGLSVWAVCLAAFVMVFCYLVTDNIAYSNLQKRYEKTYAYCVRLLDRIEGAKGYYQGIPIAIVGVVGDDQFPLTDITTDVTSGMVGIGGDQLLYTGSNYQEFMKHYLGATLNFLSPEETRDIYFMEEYIAMESFPGETSVQVIDGILCVKTENTGRD
ncbi:MAG: glucosyltransferase domain-containing protein [Candidatus Gastranaerophilales bacterium]|nr:glucosyltransferase domain-containing protein [Candidatus Gastranaerophilales bacterium]